MKIAVDFEGTIVDHQFPDIGKDVPGAFYYLDAFQKHGAKLILFTMRSDGRESGNVLSEAIEHCNKKGIIFFGINSDPEQAKWTSSPKAYAEIYIDDAAYGCPLKENPRMGGRPYVDWDIVGPDILNTLIKRKVNPS